MPPIICWKMVQASSSGILSVAERTWMVEYLLFALDDVVEELAVAHILHYQEQLLWCLDDLVQLDDVRVPDQLQDVDLS